VLLVLSEFGDDTRRLLARSMDHHRADPRDNRRRLPSFATAAGTTTPPPRKFVDGTPRSNKSFSVQNNEQQQQQYPLSRHILAGLSTAGVAATILTSLFSQITIHQHVVAKSTYTFPSYDSGARVALLTVASLTGACWFDHQTAAGGGTSSTISKRSDWIGLAGLLLTLSFVISLLRAQTKWVYEAGFAIFTIVLASTATDDHRMTYKARIWFQMSSEILNLVATLVVMVGSFLFLEQTNDNDDNDRATRSNHLFPTDQGFVLALVVLALVIFLSAQNMIRGLPLLSLRSLVPKRKKEHDDNDIVVASTTTHPQSTKAHRLWQWRQVLRDCLASSSFRAWIGMEMMLESQVLFHTAFLPTIWQRLVDERGSGTAWLEPATKPLRQLVGILMYIPMRQLGYVQMYTLLFYSNLMVSLLAVNFADHASTALIYPLLFAYPIISGAVLNCGFQFAMADMTLELKHAQVARGNAEQVGTSVAALLLGLNAVFCKPMKHLFTVAAKIVLHQGSGSKSDAFYLLVATPLVCSLFQLFFWRGYSLTPKRVLSIRDELQRVLDRRDSSGQASV